MRKRLYRLKTRPKRVAEALITGVFAIAMMIGALSPYQEAVAVPTENLAVVSAAAPGVTAGVTSALLDLQKSAVIEAEAHKTTVVASAKAAENEPIEEEEIQEEEPEDLSQNQDVILLAKLGQTEAGGLPLNEIMAVDLTVLYRVNSPRYPSSVAGVIYQPYQYAAPSEEYSDKCLQAAIKAYSLWREGRGSEILPEEYLYFFGNGVHNYFYNSKHEIYNFPGVPVTGSTYAAMGAIVPELRGNSSSTEVSVEEPALESEAEAVEEELEITERDEPEVEDEDIEEIDEYFEEIFEDPIPSSDEEDDDDVESEVDEDVVDDSDA